MGGRQCLRVTCGSPAGEAQSWSTPSLWPRRRLDQDLLVPGHRNPGVMSLIALCTAPENKGDQKARPEMASPLALRVTGQLNTPSLVPLSFREIDMSQSLAPPVNAVLEVSPRACAQAGRGMSSGGPRLRGKTGRHSRGPGPGPQHRWRRELVLPSSDPRLRPCVGRSGNTVHRGPVLPSCKRSGLPQHVVISRRVSGCPVPAHNRRTGDCTAEKGRGPPQLSREHQGRPSPLPGCWAKLQ